MGETVLIIGILLLVGCLLCYLLVRRVRLMRGGGVDVCLRRRPVSAVIKDASAGWHFGVARYRGDELVWYRLTSLRPGPSVVLDRMTLEIMERRQVLEAEAYVIPQVDWVLVCRSGGMDVEMAMGPGVLTGFLSWLESAPPGRNPGYYRVS